MTTQQPHPLPSGDATYSSAMADATRYMNWILESFAAYLQAPVLEIGVGHGSYAAELRTLGMYHGVDIDEDSVRTARQRFPDLSFAVADITSKNFVEQFSSLGIQSVVCLNVLEHIDADNLALDNLARILVSGGHALIVVPALPLLFNDLDRLAGHCRRYYRQEMRRKLKAAGLRPVRVDYFNPVGGVGWLVNRLKHHRSLNDTAVNAQITFFDRYLVPISRACDPLTRAVFGQSVIAVGRKP